MKKIRLIFSDNEGCILPGKGIAFPLAELAKLSGFLKQNRQTGFGICTGRPVPYIEAMVQTLDLLDSPVPCICDGGATLYWPKEDRWELISPTFNKNLILDVVSGLDYREEPGKIGCISLFPNESTTVDELFSRIVRSPIQETFNVTKSVAAVDITVKGVNKSFGVKEVCKRLGVSLKEILYIGDAENDIELLQLAGYSACPNNAKEDVKKIVQFVASSESTLGEVEILNHFANFFHPEVI